MAAFIAVPPSSASAFTTGTGRRAALAPAPASAHCLQTKTTLRASRRQRRHATICATSTTPTNDAAPPQHTATTAAAVSSDLMLRRRDLVRDLRHLPAVRYKRQCTPADIDMDDADAEQGAVTMSVVVQPVRAHFRVRAQVAATMQHVCCRCLSQYSSPVRGSFEVWLSASGPDKVAGFSDEEVRQLEAVEDFSPTNAQVDLAPHARDALLLAAPSKPLCSCDCPGIQAAPGTQGSVTYGIGEEVKAEPAGRGLFDGVEADKLSGLRDLLK